MHNEPKKVDLDLINLHTDWVRRQLESWKAALEDQNKETRLKALECIRCFYIDLRIGGAAFTSTNCGICSVEMRFGNTNVDIVCKPCAKKYNICCHCVATLDLKFKRKFELK